MWYEYVLLSLNKLDDRIECGNNEMPPNDGHGKGTCGSKKVPKGGFTPPPHPTRHPYPHLCVYMVCGGGMCIVFIYVLVVLSSLLY